MRNNIAINKYVIETDIILKRKHKAPVNYKVTSLKLVCNFRPLKTKNTVILKPSRGNHNMKVISVNLLHSY